MSPKTKKVPAKFGSSKAISYQMGVSDVLDGNVLPVQLHGSIVAVNGVILRQMSNVMER